MEVEEGKEPFAPGIATRMNRIRLRMRVLSDLKAAPPPVFAPLSSFYLAPFRAGIALAAAATNITAAFGKIE